ncbi:secreted protein [Candidatus Magnetobacterium bavaricum]|uniref:Secreted protein n=1 Tax=Candidatus Magnetobacterium bavaricum TaxID=29290 RepID=A0A0F3GR22_9BACT|nr:secreted protein [Candidatus Magnetobacterium bavaricum]
MAPGAALLPARATPSSNAGPAAPAPTSIQSLQPTATSAFVPTSISTCSPSLRYSPLASTPATRSPPT